MEQYLKQFTNHSQYESYIATDYAKPNVSYCVQQNEVHYNPIVPFEEQYLTFDILTDGTVQWYPVYPNVNTIYASLDNGNTWQALTQENDTLDVVQGDKIIFKGESINYANLRGEWESYSSFGGTSKFNVSGNILSLNYGDNFRQYTVLPQIEEYDMHFYGLFSGSNVVSAKNLVMPLNTTNLHTDSYSSYANMFSSTPYLEEIPEKIPVIQNSFLSYSGIKNLIISNNVISIDVSFYNCSMLSIIVESGNPVYDSRNNCNAIIETATNKLIYGCRNTVIPNDIITIGYDAFFDQYNITSMIIPNSVTTIETRAFYECYDLTSITIPSSVTNINSMAFEACRSLTSATILATTPPTLGSGVFSYTSHPIYVPAESVNTYKAASGWSTYASRIQAIPTT